MSIVPIAQADSFTVSQGPSATTITGNLGADNGAGLDHDPDGSILGWVAGTGFSPYGDGDRYLGASFSNGMLTFLHITGTVSYPFPIVLTSTSITTAEGGIVTLDTSGNFSYQSVLGFAGVDSFTYTLVDSDFNVTTATVTLQVQATPGANDRPVAQADAFVFDEDTVLNGNLLADNGHGVDGDPDGDALHVGNATIHTQAGGVVQIFGDGTFSYAARAGYSGIDGFDYTLLDPSGAKDIGHVSLTVLAVNDPPVAVDDSYAVSHDAILNGNVLTGSGNGSDWDADGDSLSVLAGVFATDKGGQVTLLADGSFAYAPAASYVGPDGFDYTVLDALGAGDVGHVTLDVVNHAPTAQTDRFAVAYRGAAAGNLLANNGAGRDSDADGDALSVVAGRFVSAKGSVLTVLADGRFAFAASDLSYGVEVMSYALVDALGATSVGTVRFNVAGHGGIQGTGLAEAWIGTDLADVIMMAAGNDTVDGLGGDDVIGGGAHADVVNGGLGNDRLYGEAGKDVINGGGGADRIDGGAGVDRLTGGAGADQFVLTAFGPYDSDRITDFAAIDRLVFQAADFGLGQGALADATWLVAAGAADGAHGRFVFDAAAKSLLWDEDGLAATAAEFLVRFDTKQVVTLDNILLI